MSGEADEPDVEYAELVMLKLGCKGNVPKQNVTPVENHKS
jgi:hypothetical protein